jgi:hypothetical protein
VWPRFRRFPKPPKKGKGAVPQSQRDPQRGFNEKQKVQRLMSQDDKCRQCGEPLKLEDSKGHHMERHADVPKVSLLKTIMLLCAKSAMKISIK